LIDEAIGEFPYEGDADRANAFGTLLTTVIRHAIAGKSPLGLFDAPQAGTGKSLLAEVIGFIPTGSEPAMMGAVEDDNEWRKQITSTLLRGPTIIIIDNIDGVLSSPSLARVLTSSVWSDRVLGASQQVDLQQVATWIGTGNNIALGGDMPRRCYRVRLDAKMARPWAGRTFKHPNLMEWVTLNRGRLVWALLTMARGWHAAGRPAADSPVLGSFEAWSRAIGGILEHAGIHGFLQNLDDLYSGADEEAGEWETFLRAWHARYGQQEIPVSKLIIDLQAEHGKDIRDVLPGDLGGFVTFIPSKHLEPDKFLIRDVGRFKIKFGKQLKQHVGRRYGENGLHLMRRDDTHLNAAVWSVTSSAQLEDGYEVEERMAIEAGV
jgi:hypothetical protein